MTDDVKASTSPDEEAHPGSSSRVLRLVLSPLTLFILIAIAFLVILIFYGSATNESTDDTVLTSPLEKTAIDKTTVSASEEPAKIEKAVAARTRLLVSVNTMNETIKPKESSQKEHARKQRIESLADEIYEELKNEGNITTHTFFLKSGHEINCTLLNDMGTHWKINHKGMTTIIEKKRVESIKSRTPQSVEMELRKMALEQATEIVDDGLVHYEGNWVTPDEKKLRIHVAKTEAEIRKIEAQKRAGIPAPQIKRQLSQKTKPSASRIRSDSSAITMVGGFGFDDIVVGHFRCTKTFIKSRLGEPNAEKEHVLDYDNIYGITFIMATDADLLIEIHLSQRFKGKVLPGISMSSSLQDIFEAYGQPVEEITVESMRLPYYKYRNRTLYRERKFGRLAYRDIGLLFWFAGDRINQIVIHRK